MADLPEVTFVNAGNIGRRTRILLDGVDITSGIYDFRVGASTDSPVEMELKLVCGKVRWVDSLDEGA